MKLPRACAHLCMKLGACLFLAPCCDTARERGHWWSMVGSLRHDSPLPPILDFYLWLASLGQGTSFFLGLKFLILRWDNTHYKSRACISFLEGIQLSIAHRFLKILNLDMFAW